MEKEVIATNARKQIVDLSNLEAGNQVFNKKENLIVRDNENEINAHLLRATYVSKSSCCRNPGGKHV